MGVLLLFISGELLSASIELVPAGGGGAISFKLSELLLEMVLLLFSFCLSSFRVNLL